MRGPPKKETPSPASKGATNRFDSTGGSQKHYSESILDSLKRTLGDRALEFCQYAFPHGKRDGKEFKIGNLVGDPGHSLSVCLAGEKTGVWKDFATGEGGSNLLDLLFKVRGDKATAIREAQSWAGMLPAPAQTKHEKGAAFNWRACVQGFGDSEVERLAHWRGYSGEIIPWLRKHELVGLYNGCVAFPVHDARRAVVGCHYRPKDGKAWYYAPKGCSTQPLIIGDIFGATQIHLFESPWDCFAVCDRIKLHESDGIAAIITRGAGNGALVDGKIPTGADIYAWPQNDDAGQKWFNDICEYAGASVRRIVTPEGIKDANEWTKNGKAAAEVLLNAISEAKAVAASPSRPRIEFLTPRQLAAYTPPLGAVLVGDYHLVCGNVGVLAGAPGVGKSRASVALAVAGAIGGNWFGLPVHRKFKTMIVQNENGALRLHREFSELNCEALDDYIRICPPPPYGLCFDHSEFRTQLALAIHEFAPDVVVIDPWNAVARDEKAKDYLETFELIRSLLPAGDDGPALLIVGHTRKPQADERATGRGLLKTVSGSYVLVSVPRTVYVLQTASDDPQDTRVVFTCCKNNDGDLGPRSAWERRNGVFVPVADFDFDAFDNPGGERVCIRLEDIEEVFEGGRKAMTRSQAAKAIEDATGAKRSASYNALKKYASHLREEGKNIRFCPPNFHGNSVDEQRTILSIHPPP